MTIRRIALIATILSALASYLSAFAAAPGVDYIQLGRYARELYQSKDPDALAIRRHLESAHQDLQAEIAKARGDRIEPDLAKLAVTIPSTNDAADKQLALMNRPASQWPDLPQYAQPLRSCYHYADAQIATVRDILASQSDLVDRIRRATDQTGSTLNSIDLTNTSDVYQKEGLILEDEAHLGCCSGDFAKAAEDNLRLYNLAAQTDPNTTSVYDIDAVRTETVAEQTTLDMIDMAGADADKRAIISAMLDKSPRIETLKQRLSFEYARQVQDNKRDRVYNGPLKSFVVFKAKLADAQTAYYLPILRTAIDEADSSPRKAFEMAMSMKQVDEVFTPLPTIYNYSTQNIYAFVYGYTRVTALNHTIEAALAVLGRQAPTESFPELLPVPVIDPYTGESLRYRIDGPRHFSIYSAGPTLRFDGHVTDDVVQDDKESFFEFPAPSFTVHYDLTGPIAASVDTATAVEEVPSAECVEVVKQFLDARNKGDLDAAFHLVCADATQGVAVTHYFVDFSPRATMRINATTIPGLIRLLMAKSCGGYSYALGSDQSPGSVGIDISPPNWDPASPAPPHTHMQLIVSRDPFDGNSAKIDPLATIEASGDPESRKFNTAFRQIRSEDHLRTLNLAVEQYLQVNGLCPDADRWQDELYPYVKSRLAFHNPLLPNSLNGYAFNRALSGSKRPTGKVVYFQECDCPWKNAVFSKPFAMIGPGYEDGTAYATADETVT